MNWFTSDFHFCHDREFVWQARGYGSIDEMNADLIAKFNSKVKPTDNVYILGDLILNNNKVGLECIKQLNGKLHIICGNHDTNVRRLAYTKCKNVIEVVDAKYLKIKKQMFFLSHFPTLCGNNDEGKPLESKIINICGHAHTTDWAVDMDKGVIFHAEVDAHNGYPVTADEIIAKIKERM